ncbi:MAG: hypothetical protein JSU95_15205 [Betaproteobacteria bacterium]|nr:MAG: hypothetical protein JSU95_15205 [Betaproteobacteria bacterium]
MKLKGILQTTTKTLFLPVTWIHERLLSGTPSSPPEFWLFINELHKNGVFARLQMQTLRVDGVSKSAIVTLDPKRSQFNVVNLFKCDSIEAAANSLAELCRNPGMSHCQQRDRYLMSITSTSPDDELADKVTDAFEAFQLPPDNSLPKNLRNGHAR